MTTYHDSPDLIHTIPTVPSLIQYDGHGGAVRYGYEVPEKGPQVVRWFKTMLLSDDDSPVRRGAESCLNEIRLTEEKVITDYLFRLLENAREHVAALVHGPTVWRILAALPSQADELARRRYASCLRAAAERAELTTESLDIYSEGLAVARSCLDAMSETGRFLYLIHDGGGGTTHFHMMLVNRTPEGRLIREDVWAPEYLPVGGEHMTVRFEELIRAEYPQLSESQRAGFSMLWQTCLKVKRQGNWTLERDIKALLPDDFALSPDFQQKMDERVFLPVAESIATYLHTEYMHGRQVLRAQKHHGRTDFLVPGGQRGLGGDEATQPDDSASEATLDEDWQVRLVSSGGQSNDYRLQGQLRLRFGEQWTRTPNPRTGVVDGLLQLYADRTANSQDIPRAKHAYGWVGWSWPGERCVGFHWETGC